MKLCGVVVLIRREALGLIPVFEDIIIGVLGWII